MAIIALVSENYLSFGIGILYPVFFKKLSDVISDYETKDCYLTNDPSCIKEQESAYKKAKNTEFMVMFIAGLVGLIMGVIMAEKTKFSGSPGLALGGLLTIIYSAVLQWGYIDDKRKMLLVGSGLIALIYTATLIKKTK